VPELLVTVGYPEGRVPRGPVRRSLRKVMHLDGWNRRAANGGPEEGGPEERDGAEGDQAARVRAAGGDKGPEDGRAAERDAGPVPGLRVLLLDHLRFLAASARGLLAEPAEYGPYRLVDACERVIDMMAEVGLESPGLTRTAGLIRKAKLSVMDDAATFGRLLDEVLVGLSSPEAPGI
jgi:hypothetical protein